MIMNRPFVFGVSAIGDNFTDRKLETQRLVSNFQNGVNTIIISPRRWGKTSLVRKAGILSESKDLKVVYLDIFSCKTELEFYNAFVTAVIKQTSNKLEEWVSLAKSFLSRISPKITLGVDPSLDFSISFDLIENKEFESEILSLPERIAQKKNIRIVICIDEFQQILDFEHNDIFQKKLRTIWQHQTYTSYCLFGSKKHLMSLLFEKKSLPFYKFGDVLYLQKISTEDWIIYIKERFEISGKDISDEYARLICQYTENHSYYVQQLSWLVWLRTEKNVEREGFENAVYDLLEQNALLFQRDFEYLTSYQMNFIRLICDGIDTKLTRKDVLSKYDLGTSSSIIRIKKALIQKEIIDDFNQKVSLIDPIFGLWFKKEIQNKKIV